MHRDIWPNAFYRLFPNPCVGVVRFEEENAPGPPPPQVPCDLLPLEVVHLLHLTTDTPIGKKDPRPTCQLGGLT